jgi:hypothetical protein
MKLDSLIQKISATARGLGKKNASGNAPRISEGERIPYGPFRLKIHTTKGVTYTVHASTDCRNWTPVGQTAAPADTFEYVDSEALKFGHRFYRVQVGQLISDTVIGYVSMTLPPGFSMIANPLDAPTNYVADLFRGWPDGTTLNRFDTRLFRLAENGVQGGKWTNPTEKLLPGEGAIFFNPSNDYKALTFAGEVLQGNLSIPIPSGFSIRSSIVPQPGNLEELQFPIANGDVVHIFDRERQKYVLYPFEEGKWTSGVPVLSVGESFWIAKTEAGNWVRSFVIPTAEA